MAKDTAQSLTGVIEQIDAGNFVAQATNKTAKLVTVMNDRARDGGGKVKGKITITLEFILDRGIFEINGKASVVEPATVHGRTFLYGKDDGSLVREDPRQGMLALATPVRDGTPDLRGGRDRASGQ